MPVPSSSPLGVVSRPVSVGIPGPVPSSSPLGVVSRPVSVGIPGPVPSSSPLGVVSRPVSVGIPGPVPSSSPLGVVSRPVSVGIPGPVPSSSPLGVVSRPVSVGIPGPVPSSSPLGVVSRPVSVGIPGPVPSSSPLGVVSRPVSVGIPGPVPSSSPLGVVSSPVGTEDDSDLTYLHSEQIHVDGDDGCSHSEVDDLLDQICTVAEKLNYPCSLDSLTSVVSLRDVCFSYSEGMSIHNSHSSWKQHYPVISFMLNGHLHIEYVRLSGALGLPVCSFTQWHRILQKLEVHVTDLAKWSCKQVCGEVRSRGDAHKWVAAYDGFYLTRGHYSNNSSGTLHDYESGKITHFAHRTKRGLGHNWEGTSAAAETDMLDELLREAKKDGFVVKEMVTDKDSSANETYCKYFPEGILTYCSNHCTKAFHKHLETVKRNKCQVGKRTQCEITI